MATTPLIAPIQALELVLEFVRRGFRFVLDDEVLALEGPLADLTFEDRCRFRQWKPELRQLYLSWGL
jgi:hypothetical protein